MSKFLRNLLQISKGLVYSKIKFYSEKNFSFTFGPIGPAASRPIWPFSPATAHLPSPPCQPIGPPAQWPSAGPPGLSLSSLANVRAPPDRLLPRVDRRRLTCVHAASWRRLRSRNGWSTYSSSLPTAPPGRFPSETAAFIPLWRTTAAAHSLPTLGRPAPPPSL
jgi:hypothetical protein